VSVRGLSAGRLIIADLAGETIRRLDRFSRSRQPIGDIALSDSRIAWAVLASDGDLKPGAAGAIRGARLPGPG
jgi:hypothetical protein